MRAGAGAKRRLEEYWLRDYFVLLEVDGTWKIANETSSAVPPR